MAVSTGYFAWSAFVVASRRVRTLSPNLVARWTRCSELRAVASTRCPALRASSVKARPRPREAPVISQTFDMLTSYASLPSVRCSFFDHGCNLPGLGVLVFAVRRACGFPLNKFEIEDEDRIDHRNQQQGDESGAEHSAHLRVTHRFPKGPTAKGQWDESNY